ncbi:MAG: hypothetical protein U9N82_06440 [Thermodesulfobacteriota bacterium]|nr:hypothetical protein [Thermodesulfobacteriota bacterium]
MVFNTKWYSVIALNKPSSDKIILDAEVLPDSPWFSGHFPGEPILPGIAQIEMALDAIKHLTQKDLKISNVKRVRFKQIIRPGDKLQIIATSKKEKALAFSYRISVKGELACHGIMTAEDKD